MGTTFQVCAGRIGIRNSAPRQRSELTDARAGQRSCGAVRIAYAESGRAWRCVRSLGQREDRPARRYAPVKTRTDRGGTSIRAPAVMGTAAGLTVAVFTVSCQTRHPGTVGKVTSILSASALSTT